MGIPHSWYPFWELPEHHGKQPGPMPEASAASRRQGTAQASFYERSLSHASPWPHHCGAARSKRAILRDPEADLGGVSAAAGSRDPRPSRCATSRPPSQTPKCVVPVLSPLSVVRSFRVFCACLVPLRVLKFVCVFGLCCFPCC